MKCEYGFQALLIRNGKRLDPPDNSCAPFQCETLTSQLTSVYNHLITFTAPTKKTNRPVSLGDFRAAVLCSSVSLLRSVRGKPVVRFSEKLAGLKNSALNNCGEGLWSAECRLYFRGALSFLGQNYVYLKKMPTS